MTVIAERADTSIGGLYRYFPDKAAVAHALLQHYAQQAEPYWTSLTQEAKELPVNDFADRLVSRMEEFAAEHRAYLPLMAAPLKFSRDSASKRNLRAQFSKAFRARSQSDFARRKKLKDDERYSAVRRLFSAKPRGVR